MSNAQRESQQPSSGQDASAHQADTSSHKNKPAHEVRLGKVKATIWANPVEGGVRHNVVLRRLFKRDPSAPWEQSDSFSRDDLPLVAEVVQQAWRWIFSQATAKEGAG